MRSTSPGEADLPSRTSGRQFPSFLSFAVLLSLAAIAVPARAGVSLAEMARLEASDALTLDNTLRLFRGYLSRGLLPEATSLLERANRVGTFPSTAATSLFDDLVNEQSRFDAPDRLFSICETAIRSGVRTPLVFYFYGTALRGVPGRMGEASAALAQVDPKSPYHLLALYSLGQIAAERRDVAAAENLFRRVEQESQGLDGGGFLAARATRSRAELLLASGRGGESAPLFEALLRKEAAPLDRIGFASTGIDPVDSLERLPAEMTAGLPLKERIQFLLLFGGLARESGRYGLAVDRLGLAGEELEEAFTSSSALSSRPPAGSEILESLRLQIENIRSVRQKVESLVSRPDEADRAGAVELLIGMLLADWTVSRVAAETPSAGARFLTSLEIGEIVRRIEEVILDGAEVDRLVEQLSATLDTLQNLGHPIQRYRYLVRLEKSQEEIHILRERIRERRSETVAAVESSRIGDASLLLRDLGLYLNELYAVRSVTAETREFTRNYFDIFRRNKERTEEAEDPLRRTIRSTVAYTDGRLKELLPVVRTLEKGEQVAIRERNRPQLLALRAVVRRQLADALVAKARWLRQDPREESRKEAFAALGQAVSLLSGDRLAPTDAADVAVQVGSLLAEGKGRWVSFPGWSAGEMEREMIERILPLLPAEGPQGSRREEALYLRSVLRLAAGDPGAGEAARDLLEKYPASPLAAEIGVRLGHETLLAGDTKGAAARYRAAAEAGAPETSAVARYMLAWIRFQSGDADGAARELSQPLSAPSFPCGDPSPFEQAVLSLSVRAWRESPPERLDSYPPVKAGTCGGKVLLTALWEAEEKRGEVARAAMVRDVATRRFPSDEGAADLEMKTVEDLLRTGQDREAFARGLTLRGKYGPDSAWARSQTVAVRERTAAELAGMLKTLSERKFDDGIRSGERSTMSSAAALMGEYFELKGWEATDEDGELRLKWAIALLGSGDREGGVLLLEELVGEQRVDATGERAAVLYAETMIAGYERKESTSEDAEDAASLLLGEHPSEKAVTLALRASSAFLAGREYERARRLAEEVEGIRFAPPAMLAQARLIQAEAALFEGDLAAARDKVALVPADPAAGGDAGSAARAKDLYLLSSLREVDGKVSDGDPGGAAAMLDELSLRFPDAPEAPLYLLRAMRLYAEAGNTEGTIRTGLRFLKEFPRREETVEVAGVVGPLLERSMEFVRAGELYEGLAGSSPKSEAASRFLFHAARLAEVHGPPDATERRFSAYRARYTNPAWMWTYATLSVGLAAGQRGDTKASIRLMEEGLRKVDSGMEGGTPEELAVLAARARIAIGENWAEQFRMTRLLLPLDKSLAIKDRLFRRALAAFSKAEDEAPLELSLQASQLSGDLLVEYGKAILASQRPKGLKGSDREAYEEGLKARARSFFERSLDWYAGALDRLEEEEGPSDLATPIRNRLDAAQSLMESTGIAKEGMAE